MRTLQHSKTLSSASSLPALLAALPRLLGDARTPTPSSSSSYPGQRRQGHGPHGTDKVTRWRSGREKVRTRLRGCGRGRAACVRALRRRRLSRSRVVGSKRGRGARCRGRPDRDRPAVLGSPGRRRYRPAREQCRAGERRDARQIARPRGDRRGATSGQAAAGHGLREPVSGATRRRSDCGAGSARAERAAGSRAGPDARRRRASTRRRSSATAWRWSTWWRPRPPPSASRSSRNAG